MDPQRKTQNTRTKIPIVLIAGQRPVPSFPAAIREAVTGVVGEAGAVTLVTDVTSVCVAVVEGATTVLVSVMGLEVEVE